MNELRITDTNSANDSKGRVFGLEGNDFIPVLVGFVSALGFFLLLYFLLRLYLGLALAVSLPILLLPLGWVVFLRHNRPEGYAEDWIDQKIGGSGWSLSPLLQSDRLNRDPDA
jgi:hypothetical protein